MKKIKTLLIIFSIAGFTLTACTNNNNNNNANGTPTPQQNQSVDLVWWNLFDDQSIIQPLIDKYKTLHPEVNIQYVQKKTGLEQGTLLDSYRQELEANLTDKEPLNSPDIITIQNTWLGRYQPYLSPSDTTVIDRSYVESNFFPIVSKDFVRNNNVYAVPMSMDALALIVNKSLMTQLSPSDSAGPNISWFDFVEQTKRLTRSDKDNIQIAGFSGGVSNTQFLPEFVSLLMLQSNVTMVETDKSSGFTSKVVFDKDPEAKTVIDSYRSLYNPNKVWNEKFNSEAAAFLSKRLVMFAAPSWRLNDVLQLKSLYNIDMDIGVYPLPQINPNDSSKFVQWPTYWGMAVTLDSQQRGQSKAAWEFLKFITSEEQLQMYNTNVTKRQDRFVAPIYPRMSMAQDQKKDQYLKVYVEALEKAQDWDMIDGQLVRNIFLEDFGASGNPTAEDIAGKINSDVVQKRTTLVTGK